MFKRKDVITLVLYEDERGTKCNQIVIPTKVLKKRLNH